MGKMVKLHFLHSQSDVNNIWQLWLFDNSPPSLFVLWPVTILFGCHGKILTSELMWTILLLLEIRRLQVRPPPGWQQSFLIDHEIIGCMSDWWSGGCGFDPHRVCNIFSWRFDHEIFSQSFSPFHWFKKGSCQFPAKECAQYWFTA